MDHSKREALSTKQLGMLVALACWAMMFGTLTLSFLLGRERFKVWPPIGTEPVPQFVSTLSTVTLLLSSYFLHEAYKGLRAGKLEKFASQWRLTFFLGLLFVVLQLLLWQQLQSQGLLVSQGLFASMVYTLIAFHGLHVLVALGLLAWVMRDTKRLRNTAQAFSAQNYQRPQLVGWFWHFMDVTWVVFFILLVIL